MSNLKSYFDKYGIFPRDFSNSHLNQCYSSMKIYEPSIEISEVEYFNNDPTDLIIANKATEIISLGYFHQIVPNFGRVNNGKQERKEIYCFVTRFSFHGTLKNKKNIKEEDILSIIKNRFSYSKDKYHIRLLDFSFSNFYSFNMTQAPSGLIELILETEGFSGVEREFLIGASCSPNVSRDLKDRICMLLELTGE